MKELSIKEKAKAYEETLNRAKKELNACGSQDCDAARQIFGLFPELSESEDERIRKELIEHVRDQQSSFISAPDCRDEEEEKENTKYNSWIAWLEKQGEKGTNGNEREIPNSEQKPADKVEPKFHEGEWIVRELDNTCYQIKKCILNVTNNKYGYDLTSGGYISSQDANFYHLWTLQDAKDGDVLTYRDGQWVFIFKNMTDDTTFKYHALISEKDFAINDSAYTALPSCIVPATKKQRDTLMKAMTNAGYTFDFEKKELKKIEQKPAWSEEDEDVLEDIEEAIINYWHGQSQEDLLDWLKPLKDRVQPQSTWKPSDEQIEILDMVLTNESMDDNVARILRELREQLKKLREG